MLPRWQLHKRVLKYNIGNHFINNFINVFLCPQDKQHNLVVKWEAEGLHSLLKMKDCPCFRYNKLDKMRMLYTKLDKNESTPNSILTRRIPFLMESHSPQSWRLRQEKIQLVFFFFFFAPKEITNIFLIRFRESLVSIFFSWVSKLYANCFIKGQKKMFICLFLCFDGNYYYCCCLDHCLLIPTAVIFIIVFAIINKHDWNNTNNNNNNISSSWWWWRWWSGCWSLFAWFIVVILFFNKYSLFYYFVGFYCFSFAYQYLWIILKCFPTNKKNHLSIVSVL